MTNSSKVFYNVARSQHQDFSRLNPNEKNLLARTRLQLDSTEVRYTRTQSGSILGLLVDVGGLFLTFSLLFRMFVMPCARISYEMKCREDN